MIHFTSLQAHQAFMKAISEPETGNQLLFRVMRLLNGDAPQIIRLHVSRQDDIGKYFDFVIHAVPVEIYHDISGTPRPDLTEMPNSLFTAATKKFNGGLVLSASGWSCHT